MFMWLGWPKEKTDCIAAVRQIQFLASRERNNRETYDDEAGGGCGRFLSSPSSSCRVCEVLN